MMRRRTSRRLAAVAALALGILVATGCGRRTDPRIREGYDLIVANKIDEAVALANAILTEDPKNAPARNLIGLALYKAGDEEGAVEQYRRALEIEPKYAEAHFNLGNAYERLERLQDAEVAFASAIRHQEGFVLARYNLARIYAITDRPQEAMTELRRAAKKDPQFYPAFVLLGKVAYEVGDFETSIENLARSLELDPTAKELRVLLGNAYLQSALPDRLTRAEAEFRAAAGIDPHYVEALYSLGMSLAAQNRNDEAAQWFRQARPIAAGRPDAVSLVQQIDAFFARTGLPAEEPGSAEPAAEG